MPSPDQSCKKLQHILRAAGQHWVGDGFPVRSLFAYNHLGQQLSPFLLLDYAGPVEFPPTQQRLGVGEHPHRGFETVTIVYAGEVEHRDSSGGGGRIGPGDVQWMTAASGVVHEEFHGREFAQRGGWFEMAQLWVNLPAKHKMAAPRYQNIEARQIPTLNFPGNMGSARVIAGELLGATGPALTYTPLQAWDLRLHVEDGFDLPVADGYTTLLVVLQGSVRVAGATLHSAEVGLFERGGDTLRIERADQATVLLLAGEPIAEPIVGQGPFVMNTPQEIQQAIRDYQSGSMGHLA
jgi:redox-sensitive bicupin YhaK (pirin superfamily)